MVFFDTETNARPVSPVETEHRLRLGWACYWCCDSRDRHGERHTWHPFTTGAGFIDLLEALIPARASLYAVCHNLDFDGAVTGILLELPRRGWEMLALFTDSGAKIWRFRRGNRTLVFLDSLNYFKESLESLGRRVGLQKGKVDFATVGDDELSEYCRQDVAILVKVFTEYRAFLQGGDYGNFAVSAASQAFKTYTHRFLKDTVYIHDKAPAIDLERAAYCGGRCECFRLGVIPGGPFYKLDVNSLYPHIMATRPHPVKLAGYYRLTSRSELERLSARYTMIARVTVQTDQPRYPYRKGGKLLFPVGTFETVLAGDELALALETGAVLEAREAALYVPGDLFSGFVSHFYARRRAFSEQGDAMYAYLCKLMMNSLYGKFGQRASDWVTVGTADPGEVYYRTIYHQDGTHTIERCVGGLQQHRVDLGNSFNSFVAVAASVTAGGRAYLWALMQRAGLENVYYVDTDSLFVNLEGVTRMAGVLEKDHDLGLLKIEAESPYLELRQPKDYTFGDVHHRKGLSSKASYLWLDTWRQENFLSLKSLIHRGYLDRYLVTWQIKRLSSVYEKGRVLSDGRITPFVLPPFSPVLA